MPQHGAAVGIDLGSSSCRIGLWRDGDVLIVPNDRGFFSQKWGRIFSMCAHTHTHIYIYTYRMYIIHIFFELRPRNIAGTFAKSCNGCWIKMIWKGYEKKT